MKRKVDNKEDELNYNEWIRKYDERTYTFKNKLKKSVDIVILD